MSQQQTKSDFDWRDFNWSDWTILAAVLGAVVAVVILSISTWKRTAEIAVHAAPVAVHAFCRFIVAPQPLYRTRSGVTRSRLRPAASDCGTGLATS